MVSWQGLWQLPAPAIGWIQSVRFSSVSVAAWWSSGVWMPLNISELTIRSVRCLYIWSAVSGEHCHLGCLLQANIFYQLLPEQMLAHPSPDSSMVGVWVNWVPKQIG